MIHALRRFLVAATSVLLLIACQSNPVLFPTNPPAGKAQLLITFTEDQANQTLLPGGSARAYRAGAWEVPITLSATLNSLERNFGLQRQKIWWMDSLNVYCAVFAVENTDDMEVLVKHLKAEKKIKDVQVMNQFVVMSSPGPSVVYNDPHWQLQYGKFAQALSSLHEFSRGQSVRVGIIDTLSDQQHPDLQNQIAKQVNYVAPTGNKVPPARARHGTAMSGIIAAKGNNKTGLVGLAPEAEVFVYAACDSDGEAIARCNSFNVLQALEQAIKDKVQILNLSIAGPYDNLVEQVIDVANRQGMVILAAINIHKPQHSFPASLDGVIGVAEFSPFLDQERDLFGDWLLRSEKLSTLSGGGYQYFYGSSISTASMSGIAALYRSQASDSQTRNFINMLTAGHCEAESSSEFGEWARLLRKATTCVHPATSAVALTSGL